jgi:hypothetical protein
VRVVKLSWAVGSGTGRAVGARVEVRPWVLAFWAERALPALVRGPVECWALRLFLAARVAARSPFVEGAVVLVDSGGKAMLHMSDPFVRTEGILTYT